MSTGYRATTPDAGACRPTPLRVHAPQQPQVGMSLVVMKFGGTSLATAARVRRAARRVRALQRESVRPVVVVSAAGQSTDRLLRSWSAVTDRGGPRLEALAREADRLLATGEDRSAALLAGALLAIGVPAVSLRGSEAGIRAAGRFGGGVPVTLHGDRLRFHLEAGVVPVVSGFQASRADGETITLGRGGSDLSAVFLAIHLGARECRIVTDVGGVYTADPRVEPAATLLPALSHDELVRLTSRGAVVVHSGAARRAARTGLPLRVFHFAAPIRNPGGSIVGAAEAGQP